MNGALMSRRNLDTQKDTMGDFKKEREHSKTGDIWRPKGEA